MSHRLLKRHLAAALGESNSTSAESITRRKKAADSKSSRKGEPSSSERKQRATKNKTEISTAKQAQIDRQLQEAREKAKTYMKKVLELRQLRSYVHTKPRDDDENDEL
mmetsp:Transcript_1538/g.2902  ORF Transcript_1538/g.2902 Transcript_1538/m.2902 type:complete len:108 (-) Transcript_1538:400-723(-)